MECVVIPVAVALILILLILIIVLLIALYWYNQRLAVRKTIHTRNSPAKQIQLEKVDKKTSDKDVENLYSNVHSAEDVITESVMKTDTH